MNRPVAIHVEILRNRVALKTWVLKRIALTPVVSELELEASGWFHNMPLAKRSKLITDLARLKIEGVNLREIAAGPVGELFRRYPDLFKSAEIVSETFAEPDDVILEEMAEPAFA